MTKQETINMIIDDYKNGSQSAMEDYCNGTRCDDCPFDFNDCMNDVACTLIKRLIKAEEKKETNLEHYYGTADIIVSTNINGIPILAVCEHAEKAHEESKTNIVDWLLSPYEPPKYKLSKFEYDLLKSYGEETESTDIFCYYSLTMMREKGYFKDIHVTATFGDVLDNCEVIKK